MATGTDSNAARNQETRRETTSRKNYGLCAFITGFFLLLLTVVIFLLCLFPTNRKVRIGILVFWTAFIATLLGLQTRLVTLSEWKTVMAPQEQRPVEKFSSIFCQSVYINTNRTIGYRLTASEPRVYAEPTVYSSEHIDVNLQRYQFHLQSYYLLKGSSMQFNLYYTNSPSSLRLLLLRGSPQRQQFLLQRDANRAVRYARSWSDLNLGDSWNYTVTRNDLYTFILYFNQYLPAGICRNFQGPFFLNKTTYGFNDTEIISAEDETTKAMIDVAETSSRFIYVISGDHEDGSSSNTDLTSVCMPRDYMYGVMFCILPLLIFGALSIIIWICFPDCESKQTSSSSAEEGTDNPSHNRSQSDVSSVSPPPFSSIPATHANIEPPPSYDEAMRSNVV